MIRCARRRYRLSLSAAAGAPRFHYFGTDFLLFCVWWWWRVDPGGGWELGGRGDLPDEPFGIVEVGVEEHIGAVLAQRLSAVVVDVCGGVVADTEDHPHILTSGRTLGQKPRASSIEPNRESPRVS